MPPYQVEDEGHAEQGAVRRGLERETGKALDEGGHHVGGDERGGQERVHQPVEPRPLDPNEDEKKGGGEIASDSDKMIL